MSYTADFPFCEFPFDQWNPVQEKCLPWFSEPRNLVLSASVASGKTAVAEAIMGWSLSQPGKSKVLYVSPLKALSAEKYNEWIVHPTFCKFKIELLDSDHHPEDFDSPRIVLSTVESADIVCRANADWLKKVNCLVFDEAHLLGSSDRGATSEAVLMKFSEICPNSRLILLSGTMSNTKELALWVNSLNNLPTSFLSSQWRPTTLYKLVEVRKNFQSQISFVVEKILKNPEEKILVFVHAKKTGETLVKKIRESGRRASFFSADLKEEDREALITKFKNPMSGLDVLVATSSLAMGVSL